jgi:serine/threonine-protein kinase
MTMSQALPARQSGALTNHTLGDYRIGELIASKGTAEVYRGRSQSQGYQVAIKVMVVPDLASSNLRKRFRDEARCMMTLHHPHNVPLKAFGEIEGALYLVMPFYPETLRDHLERSGPLPPVRAVHMALQVAHALQVTHARGLAHRHVKPENIYLHVHGSAFLADFGVAREISALPHPRVAWTRSSIGLLVGIPEYMAPEQLLGRPADQRVDVYSLAAVLYESLTGRAVFEAEIPRAITALVLSHQITPPTAYARDIWPPLEQTVLQALAYEAADRYADMETFAVALRTALGVMESERDRESWHAHLATQAEAPLQPQPACPGAQVADLQAQPTIARAVARTLRALPLRRVEMAARLNSLRAAVSAAGVRQERRIGGWLKALLTILQRM